MRYLGLDIAKTPDRTTIGVPHGHPMTEAEIREAFPGCLVVPLRHTADAKEREAVAAR